MYIFVENSGSVLDSAMDSRLNLLPVTKTNDNADGCLLFLSDSIQIIVRLIQVYEKKK